MSPTTIAIGETPEQRPRVNGWDLALVALAVVVIGGTGFIVGHGDGGSAVTGTRLFLWSWVLGMVGYTLYGVGALGALEQVGKWGALLAGILGGLLPLVAYAAAGRFIRGRRQDGRR